MADYLFDKDGVPGGEDADVHGLEQLLVPLAYGGAPPKLPSRRRKRPTLWVAAGAMAFAAVLAVMLRLPRVVPPVPASTGWAMNITSGDARVDGLAAGRMLPIGAWLETGAGRVQLVVADIGTVVVGPGTRARIVVSEAKKQQMELAQGRLTAQIVTVPRRFFVQTKSALVVDLGCAFQLDVDAAGKTSLVVTAGAVALADHTGHEVAVPAGSACEATEAGVGATHAVVISRPVVSATNAPLPLAPDGKAHPENPPHKTSADRKHSPVKAVPVKAEHKLAPVKSVVAPVTKPVPAERARPKHNAFDDLDRSAQ